MAYKSRLKIKIDGAEMKRMKRAMDEFKDDVIAAVDKSIEESAKSIQAAAKSKAPVKTGALRRGIIVQKFVTRKDTLVVYDVGMDPKMNEIFRKPIWKPKGDREDSYYPTVIEYGTPHTPAQPFLRPAAKENKLQTKKGLIEAVRQVTNRDY